MLNSARLSEIAQRLEAAKSAPRVELPVDNTRSCFVVQGEFVASSLELAVMLGQAEADLGWLLELVKERERRAAA